MKRLLSDGNNEIWTALVPAALTISLLFSFVSISLTQVFLFLSLLFWGIRLIKKREKFAFPVFFWALLVYAGLSLVSSFFSVNPEISLKDSRELLLFLMIPLVYTAFSKREEINRTTLALLASALAGSLYSLFYFMFKAAPSERITGFMGHYMTQGGLLALFCCLALSMLFFRRDKVRYIWGAGFILAAVALALTLTRSAWLGLAVAAACLLFLHKPKTLFLIPLATVLFYFFSPAPLKSRALSIFSLNDQSNQLRLEYIRAGIKIIRDYPLLGTGPDTVDMVFQDPDYGLSWEAKRNVHLHNNFIQIGAERGIPALLAWLTFILWAFLSLLKINKEKNQALLPLSAAALAALAALVVAGFFEYNFGDSEITMLFLYLLTLPFAEKKLLGNKGRRGPGKETKNARHKAVSFK